MKTAAIICEYNPLHKGHIYHMRYTKELTGCDAIVCLMSGNFMQRGIPSIMDKWNRAEIAVLSGADLVIELPAVFSVSSAEFFAQGAVKLLQDLSIIDFLSFGSESGDINLIKTSAKIIGSEPIEYRELLKKHLDEGLPFAKARSKSLIEYLTLKDININTKESIESFIESPNNILALEYCKALDKINSIIKPVTITRHGDGYNHKELSSNFASATAIREALRIKSPDLIKEHLPDYTYKKLKEIQESNYEFTFEEDMFPYLKYKLLLNNDLNKLPDVSEGLDNKIYSSIINSNSLKELILNSKSKRYTYTRLNRILCQYFIGFDNYQLDFLRRTPSSYARILAFNDKGRILIKRMKKSSQLELINKIPSNINRMLELDIQCTKAYSLINKAIEPNDDYIKSPIYL